MFAILGATGKVGSSTIRALRAAAQPVRAIIRDPAKAAPFEALGCEIGIADLQDVGALSKAIEGARGVQVICPTAPRAIDAAADMRRTIDNIARALANTRPQTTLAISDYGAEVERGTGITVLFHELEARLREAPTRSVFLRSAEHMENWTRIIQVAAQTGRLPSLHHPLSKRFPTISAHEVGRIAADLLMHPMSEAPLPRIVHAEGPRRYTPVEVADAMAKVLGRDVVAYELPRADWHTTLRGAGLGDSVVQLVTELYDAHNQGLIDAESGGEIINGTIELTDALKALL